VPAGAVAVLQLDLTVAFPVIDLLLGGEGKGGDLGWAAPSAYVKPFSDAMVKLEKGKFTEVPVPTQFGFHVIELQDVRETQFPPLDQVKNQISESIQQHQAQAFADELKKKAKIQ